MIFSAYICVAGSVLSTLQLKKVAYPLVRSCAIFITFESNILLTIEPKKMKECKFIVSTLLIIVLFAGAINAQKSKTSKSEANTVLLIKAIEKENASFELSIDAGVTKDGKKREFTKTEKEKEAVKRVIKNGSLVNLLNMLRIKGYDIETSYAVPGKEITHYYIMIPSNADKARKDVKKGQSRPELSSEEMEKRKALREQRLKEYEEKNKK